MQEKLENMICLNAWITIGKSYSVQTNFDLLSFLFSLDNFNSKEMGGEAAFFMLNTLADYTNLFLQIESSLMSWSLGTTCGQKSSIVNRASYTTAIRQSHCIYVLQWLLSIGAM